MPHSDADPATLLADIQTWHLPVEPKLWRKAWETAVGAYAGRRHEAGMDLLTHACGVLKILKDFAPEPEAVVACLAQHLLSVEGWSPTRLQTTFGAPVRRLVCGSHLLSHVRVGAQRMSIDHMRSAFLRVSDDPRVVLMVLCGKQYVLEHMEAMTASARSQLCREVLRLDAPVAARMGIYVLKHRLENLAFPVAYATDSARIAEQLHSMMAKHGKFLERVARSLQNSLRGQGLAAQVEGRQKQPYSIFVKMQEKGITHIEDIYDLFALRVIVQDVAACYQVLGYLHQFAHAVPNRFKDFIAFAKPNGYQSLHTTLTNLPGTPQGVFMEVQIRTEGMHREAEYGIAAHWSYKEGGTSAQSKRRAEFQRLLTSQQSVTQGGREGGLRDQIFVLTPRGDVIELPEGATPLDFAFSVHTDLGISFKAARVNGALVPMDYRMENGDVVEVVRSSEPHPTSRWLSLLKTASARSRLKRYLADRHRHTYLEHGKALLAEELRHRRLPPLDAGLTLLARLHGAPATPPQREDLLVKLGQGSVKLAVALGAIDALQEPVVPRGPHRAKAETAWRVQLQTDVELPHRLARCCKPVPGKREALCGVVTRQGRVLVHRSACKMLQNIPSARRVAAKWVTDAGKVSRGKQR